MELLRYESLPKEYEDQVKALLWACDHDFYPPLSARGSTTEQNLRTGEENLSGPELYFRSLKPQSWLLAVNEGKLMGFMSYIPEKVVDGIDCVYFSTLIVNPEARHQGIARLIYRTLIEDHKGRTIVLRTWSTNLGHLLLLEELGFRSYKTLKNDRGEGVDTIYFRLEA